MKKLLLSVLLVLIASNFAFASSKYPKYDEELAKVRAVKNSQISVINAEIKDLTQKIDDLEENTTTYSLDREKKLTEYNSKLRTLTMRKETLSNQYKADKARLQKLYKNDKYKTVR